MLLGAIVAVNAQSDRKINKEVKKLSKAHHKELKKAGWVAADNTLPLKFALEKYHKTLLSDKDNKGRVGRAASCSSTCAHVALNNAQTLYATETSSYVKGRIISDLFNDGRIPQPTEFNNFYAAYESKVAREMSGLLEQYIAMERPQKGGTPGFKEYQIWYIVNESEASKARLRAMKQALEESKVAQEYAERVSNFVQKGFD